jgi:uncharacterized membrane protein
LWDRQYVASIGIFVVVAVVTLIGIMSLLLWLRWAGVAGLTAIAGGFLAWFYWAPRPDLTPRDDETEPDGTQHD